MSQDDLIDIRRLLERAVLDAQWFGEYRILHRLGRGGMGVVFEADAPHLGRHVALKRLIDPDSATESEERRFLFGAEAQSRLTHDHIVKVLHVGKCHGRAYFTMELVSGGTLRDRLDALAKAPRRKNQPRFTRDDLTLLAQVTDAVTHAHAHGLLHRDLKPENILLTAAGQPQIADFGIAKDVEAESTLTEPGSVAGSPLYMAPEQAAGHAATRRSDVYSLGVILYELVTGQRPFEDASPARSRERLTSREPVVPPRTIDPSIPEPVERVCLKCLEKDPEERYLGALALRDDLRCLAGDREPSVPPRSRWGQALHFLRRNAERSRRAARVGGALFIVAAAIVYFLVARQRAEREALETNAFLATAQAGAALFQFREFADHIQQTASLPEIQQLTQTKVYVADPPPALKALAVGLDAVFIVNKDGLIAAQWPIPPLDIWTRSFKFRDYFKAAKRLGEQGKREAYVARAFQSERDREIKFGLSAPVFVSDTWTGVLVAVMSASPAFGRVRMRSDNDGTRISALIGPRDIDRAQADQPPQAAPYVVLVHDHLTRGREVRAPESPALAQAVAAVSPEHQFTLPALARLTDANYVDRVDGTDERWLAAFAPVGGTGYVIVVQSRP
jgi:hypothetical protein